MADLFGNEMLPETPDDASPEVVKREKFNPFKTFLPDIFSRKENLVRNNPDAETDLNVWLTNHALSMGKDTVFFANEMNRYSDIPKRQLYDFYIHAIPRKHRRNPWYKKSKLADNGVEMIMEFFSLSRQKALAVSDILTAKELSTIEEMLNKGGLK